MVIFGRKCAIWVTFSLEEIPKMNKQYAEANICIWMRGRDIGEKNSPRPWNLKFYARFSSQECKIIRPRTLQ